MRSNYLNTQNSYRESYVSKSTLVSPGSEADSDNQAQLILDSMQLATETFQAKVPSLILQAAQMEIDVIDDLIGDEFIALLIHIVTVSLVQAFIACNDAIISAVCHYALETLDIRDHILALELCHERVAERFPGAPPNVHANNFPPSFFELMDSPIRRKSLLDAATCSDEKLLDDVESWSDFTYASSVAESGIVEDGGTIMESIPFVEFLERGLEGNVEDGADWTNVTKHQMLRDCPFEMTLLDVVVVGSALVKINCGDTICTEGIGRMDGN